MRWLRGLRGFGLAGLCAWAGAMAAPASPDNWLRPGSVTTLPNGLTVVVSEDHSSLKLANATNAAFDPIELDPGIGSPTLGKLLGIPGLRTWQVAKFPLLWCCFERADHCDVVRLLGERQDVAAIMGNEFASN